MRILNPVRSTEPLTKDIALLMALDALEWQVKPLCMCFAGCEHCDEGQAPDPRAAINAIKQVMGLMS